MTESWAPTLNAYGAWSGWIHAGTTVTGVSAHGATYAYVDAGAGIVGRNGSTFTTGGGGGGGTYANANTIWATWTNATGVEPQWSPPPELTPEELGRRIAAQNLRAAEREAEREARRAYRELQDGLTAEARARARVLLLSLLDEDQRREWAEAERCVITAASGRRYELRLGVAGNVRVLSENDLGYVETLCCHMSEQQRTETGEWERLPREDQVIAQLLALRTDENGFRALANITPNPYGHLYPGELAA